MVARLKRWALLLICIMLFGCSVGELREQREQSFELLLSEQDKEKMWPDLASEEIVHYVYLGDLLGESNLVDIQAQQESSLSKFWSFMTGNVIIPPKNMKRPQGIVGDNQGSLYISDVSQQAIFVFDTLHGTMKLWSKAGNGTKFNSPIGLSIGLGDELLVADSELGEVIRLDLQGNPIGRIRHPSLIRPTGIVRVAQCGEIYVSDTSSHDIKVFNDQGDLLRVIGKKGNKLGEFNAPTFLGLHSKGILISDTLNARVQLLSSFTYDEKGALSGCQAPLNDAVQSSFSQSIGRRGMKLGNLNRPKGVAADSEGNIYIIEAYFDHMLVFSQNNEFLLPLGGTGHGAGEFYLPSGMWIDDKNRIYIADMMNGRVSVFQFLGGQ
jgi:6-bladed beta-propeller protein